MNNYLHLGDAALDEEHARFRELIEHMIRADSDTKASALKAVQAHAHGHFAAEDLDLRGMSGGHAACHLDEHAAVLSSLAEVCEVLLDIGMSAEEKTRLVRRLAIQLLNWLPVHVQEMDSAVAMHRSKVRFGGATIRMPPRKYIPIRMPPRKYIPT